MPAPTRFASLTLYEVLNVDKAATTAQIKKGLVTFLLSVLFQCDT
jgi:hypothetical protein